MNRDGVIDEGEFKTKQLDDEVKCFPVPFTPYSAITFAKAMNGTRENSTTEKGMDAAAATLLFRQKKSSGITTYLINGETDAKNAISLVRWKTAVFMESPAVRLLVCLAIVINSVLIGCVEHIAWGLKG